MSRRENVERCNQALITSNINAITFCEEKKKKSKEKKIAAFGVGV